ncbi:MAG TPA: cytochrome c [Terriglobales bacterium]|nr:cytochrome c [Terriglobales bacterium]
MKQFRQAQKWLRGVEAVLLLALAGCQARQPGVIESAVAQGVKRKITVGGRADHNPFPATPENIHQGQENFSHYCMVCHGLDGQNTGVPFADRMSPPVPLLSSPAVQSYSDGQLKWIIENGIFPSGMPASKGILNDDEIWQIVIYLRHLPPPGSLGEPAVYGGAGAK